MGYDDRDWEVVDYEVWELGMTGLIPDGSRLVRGPAQENLKEGNFIACLGAAQTFGAFCPRPFPALLQEELETPALNLGFGGAGPSYFLEDPELLALVNRSRLAVVQVMSGRSVSNSLYESTGTDFMIRRKDGERIAAADVFGQLLEKGRGIGPFRPPRILPRIMSIIGQRTVKRIVSESRANYIDECAELLRQITVPTIVLWISKRTPDYRARYVSARGVLSEFPQLVNRQMVDRLRDHCDEYVECVTSRGSPQQLISRFTGEPVSVRDSDARPDLSAEPQWYNGYYPSPEMHEDAAAALVPACRRLLSVPIS